MKYKSKNIDEFPKYDDGLWKGTIKWGETIGKYLNVQVDKDIKYLFIQQYEKNKHMLTVLYNDIQFEIRTDDILYNRYNKIFNTIPIRFPKLVNYFYGGVDIAKKYYPGSEKKVKMICPFCGDVKQYQVNLLTRRKYLPCVCNKRSISFPERIVNFLLVQLNEEFERQIKFEWMNFKDKNGSYTYGISDFVVENKKIIIEVDGSFHYMDIPSLNSKAEDVQYRDKQKDELAFLNGYKTIRICARLSDFNFIKNSIIQSELSNIYNLSAINWEEVEKQSLCNITKNICEIKKNHPEYSIPKIMNLYGYKRDIVANALKYGDQLGWCTYNIHDEKSRAAKNVDRSYLRKHRHKNRKQICQYTLDGYFVCLYDSIRCATDKYGKGIVDCLSGKNKTAYGYQWKYKSQNYLEKIDKYEKKQRKHINETPVFGIDKNKNKLYFCSIREASLITGVPEGNISHCLRRSNQKTAGGYIWKYADEIEESNLAIAN